MSKTALIAWYHIPYRGIAGTKALLGATADDAVARALIEKQNPVILAERVRAVVTVLESRGFDLSDDVRRRLLGCRDPETLERWLRRAATAASADEL